MNLQSSYVLNEPSINSSCWRKLHYLDIEILQMNKGRKGVYLDKLIQKKMLTMGRKIKNAPGSAPLGVS